MYQPTDPTYRCLVHGLPEVDYDTRWSEGPEPSVAELTTELVHHLWAKLFGERCPNDWCGHCYDEYMVRHHPLGIEDVNLEEQHQIAMIEESCTCDQNPQLARQRAREEARAWESDRAWTAVWAREQARGW